ncbi:patatin-like phospholipase RssA [Aliidiomarina maris]|uniref:NTE family protein n=1 Tax=Aliidiomarina maris TaxID=531312 RepID=A0A327X492_9GAMM|nr:patatin-like phospholipase RssA [Aliidiomarina maris]MBA3987736.1 patatin [Idiomarina sp.]RAK01459.1 NTE family protein [Aliidiomarina maris]RUO28296.1 patatin [Aliidiomarina maris]
MNDIKIGVALGSGAARGWAHIGVLRALQEMGIRPSVVTGTSIGSLVGGAYCAGRLDEMETWVRDMDRWEVFNLLDFSFSSGGVVSGEKVFNFAREQFGAIKVEDLDIRYAAVATDLYTGREVWLKKGDVYDVARASCAMPGLLSPKPLDNRWLVDGALVNPVPVSLNRALEADFVIAVHLNSQLNVQAPDIPPQDLSPQGMTEQVEQRKRREKEASKSSEQGFKNFLAQGQSYFENLKQKFTKEHETPGVMGVMAGAIDIMQERVTKARMAGDPPDVLLQPKLGHIGILEFERGEEAIQVGYDTTIRMRDLIMEDIEVLKFRRGDLRKKG